MSERISERDLQILWDRLQTSTLSDAEKATAREVIAELRALRASEQQPIPMLLFCPCCGHQHIDKPEVTSNPSQMSAAALDSGATEEVIWDNPPHKSHSCRVEDGGCGIIWRPADVPTTGVANIETRGKADTWPENQRVSK